MASEKERRNRETSGGGEKQRSHLFYSCQFQIIPFTVFPLTENSIYVHAAIGNPNLYLVLTLIVGFECKLIEKMNFN